MSKFKIGDRVIAYFDDYGKGTIVDIDEYNNCAIDFDEEIINGWGDEEYNITKGHGWWLSEDDLELINKGENTMSKTAESKILQVRYLDSNLTKMEKIEKGDLVDLRASRIFTCNYNYETKELGKTEVLFPYTYKQGETIFVKLGFAMKMPQGYKANVYPRSGTFANYGLLLTNSVGQIDNPYQGNEDEWGGMFYATREGTMNYDDRILQFEVVPQAMNNVIFDFVEELGDTNRGGYGSTGVK